MRAVSERAAAPGYRSLVTFCPVGDVGGIAANIAHGGEIGFASYTRGYADSLSLVGSPRATILHRFAVPKLGAASVHAKRDALVSVRFSLWSEDETVG